jgi:two-component system, sensor histidine kinase and response regulator
MTAELVNISPRAGAAGRAPFAGPSKVLVVDDDPLQREFAICQLSSPQLTVDTAGDGEEALLKLAEETYDAALIDLYMPGLDGLGLIARIKAEPKHCNMPIIIVSGSDDHALLEQSYRDGAFVFCLKPVSWRLLKAQLGHALDTARMKRLGYL